MPAPDWTVDGKGSGAGHVSLSCRRILGLNLQLDLCKPSAPGDKEVVVGERRFSHLSVI